MQPDPIQNTAIHGQDATVPANGIQWPEGVADDRNSLRALIDGDPLLGELYSDTAFALEMGGELVPLVSPLLKDRPTWYTLAPGDRIVLHVRRSLFAANASESQQNALYLQMLRDTPVVDGDEQRTKREPVFSYQLFVTSLAESGRLGADYLMADLAGIVEAHRAHYHIGVLNTLYFCTLGLRDYHYQKQQSNAYYHIQAINPPFPCLEFHYLTQRPNGLEVAI